MEESRKKYERINTHLNELLLFGCPIIAINIKETYKEYQEKFEEKKYRKN